jgi:hypothetical protein
MVFLIGWLGWRLMPASGLVVFVAWRPRSGKFVLKSRCKSMAVLFGVVFVSNRSVRILLIRRLNNKHSCEQPLFICG